jgi:hypothetical protein
METVNLTTKQAAERLAAAFGESAQHWTWRLMNERQRQAPPTRAPATKLQGRWFYVSDDLDTWIGEESGRRLARGQLPVTRAGQVLAAFGVGQGGGATGRRFDCTLTAATDETTGEVYCRMLVSDPLLVFRLPPQQVRALASELSELAAAFDRWSNTSPAAQR